MKRTKERRMSQWLLAAAGLHAALLLPGLTGAADQHPATPGDQECVECHAEEAQTWLSGKHGLMNVKCVVCHGDPETNFTPRPAMVKCRGCHDDQLQDVEKKRPAAEQGCFFCHDHHTVAPTATATTDHKGFHQGGAK